MILKVLDIEKSFGDRTLFSNVSLFLKRGQKVVLLGPNGCGKTTFLKIVTGEIEPTKGYVEFLGQKMGSIKQFRLTADRTLYEEGLSIFKDAIDAYDKAIDRAINSDMQAYTLFLEKAESLGVYSAEKKVREMLYGVGFLQKDFNRRLSTLSAGEITRLQLAKLLMADPDLLVLDEPGNYLDVYGMLFLKEALLSLKGAALIATHDRSIMEDVPDEIWDIDFGGIKSYRGNYANFVIQKENFLKTFQSKERDFSRQIKHVHNVIQRYRKWGREKAIRQAKSKEKLLEKLEKKREKFKLKRQQAFSSLHFETLGVTEDIVLKVDNLETYAGPKYIGTFTFQIHNSEKVALLGRNGEGKTTILKEIVKNGSCEKNCHVKFGPNTVFAYVDTVGVGFPDGECLFHFPDRSAFSARREGAGDSRVGRPKESVLFSIWKLVQSWPDYEVRKYLGRFGFEGNDVFKSVDSLSGGEFVRFEISKALLKNPNFLIMDEPTNHLDVYMIESLEETIKNYAGAVLFTTHDLEFAKHIADRFFILQDGNLWIFDDYDYAVDFLKKAVNQKRNRAERLKNSDFERRKSAKNRVKSIEKKLCNYESRFEELEKMVQEIDAQMVIRAADHVKLGELVRKRDKIDQEMEELLEKIDVLEKEKSLLEEEAK